MMRRTYYLLKIILSFIILSCNSEGKRTETINFKTDYKFNSEIENELKNNISSWKHQSSASDYATKGDYKNALEQWDSAMDATIKKMSQNVIDSIKLKYKKVSAVDFIVEQSKQNKVIIINEAHHNSFHRVFTTSLLQKLFDNGYKNLGLEALSYKDNLDSLQNIRKYPIKKTGYYVKDPQFGNLVREAIKIGYSIYPYETQSEEANGKQREIDHARNIKKIVESKPNEKTLIYCGFDHVLEGNHKSWEKAMAGRLTEYTGINPLTINQVVYSEKSKPEFNHPLLKALKIEKSSILIDKDNNPLTYKRGETWTDISIFYPITQYVDNRPNWLFENGNKNVSILLTDIQIVFPVMVLAFKKGEDVNLAVPVDIVEVENKFDKCNLGLQKGTYEIVVTNGRESVKFEEKVN